MMIQLISRLKSSKSFIQRLIDTINILSLLGITIIVFIAVIIQLFAHELPCPLCLLQRAGLLSIGFGFLLNIHYEIKPSHYACSLLASAITACVSLRQITLHIATSTKCSGYGMTLFGYHMYTWVFFICMMLIVYVAIILSIPQQYHLKQDPEKVSESKSPILT